MKTIGFLMLSALFVVAASTITLPLSAQETAIEQLSRTKFFRQHLAPVGGQSSEPEAEVVLQLLETIAASNYEAGFTDLEQFLETNSVSVWAPSLDAALGGHYE